MKEYQLCLKLNENDGITPPWAIEDARKQMDVLKNEHGNQTGDLNSKPSIPCTIEKMEDKKSRSSKQMRFKSESAQAWYKFEELQQYTRKYVENIAQESRIEKANEIINHALKMLDIAKQIKISNNYHSNDDIKMSTEHTNEDATIEGMIHQKLVDYMFPKPQTYQEMRNDTMTTNVMVNSDDNSDDKTVDFNNFSHEINEWMKLTQDITTIKSNDENFGLFSQNYEKTLKNILKQQNRIEQTSKKIKTILLTKSKVNKKMKHLEKDLSVQKKENDNFISNDKQSFEKLNQIKKQIEQNHKQFIQLMTSRKNTLSGRSRTELSVNTSENKLKQKRKQLNECDSLLKKYRHFKKETKEMNEFIYKLFDKKCDEFESEWLKWNEKDVVFWFKYKLKWFENDIKLNRNNDNSSVDCKEDEIDNELLSIDFDAILTNLETQRIHGKFLSVLNKSDLNNLGFKLMKHQLIIFNNIENLILQYPIPKENDNDQGIEGQVAISGFESNNNNNDNNIKIDSKYVCPVSQQLMKDPIIASNGITYERVALQSYLKQYKKLPDSDTIISDIEEEMENWFVDDQLTAQIKKIFD